MDTRSTACLALESLGWKTSIAKAAVDAALAELGPELALDPLIRAALQRCR
jgi:Holliday junction resolvasome RuvABC DNA-binding subunit